LHILKLEAEELLCQKQDHMMDCCSHLQFTYNTEYYILKLEDTDFDAFITTYLKQGVTVTFEL